MHNAYDMQILTLAFDEKTIRNRWKRMANEREAIAEPQLGLEYIERITKEVSWPYSQQN